MALLKQLRFLVVDSEEDAEYLNDFLKDKGLFKDVLVLSNIEEKKIDEDLRKRVREKFEAPNKAGMLRDVIEFTRGIKNLEKAVAYFVGNKVLCHTFDQAIAL